MSISPMGSPSAKIMALGLAASAVILAVAAFAWAIRKIGDLIL